MSAEMAAAENRLSRHEVGELMIDNLSASAAPDRDPYACQVCNCHHHTTEEHGVRDYDNFDYDDGIVEPFGRWETVGEP